jgi:hypothetical protein
MSLAISAARASFDDGNWCGTKPGPRPHLDLSSLSTSLEQILQGGSSLQQHGAARYSDDVPPCGNDILNILKHFPPPPPPPLGDLMGGVSHQVMNALMG